MLAPTLHPNEVMLLEKREDGTLHRTIEAVALFDQHDFPSRKHEALTKQSYRQHLVLSGKPRVR